MARASVSFQSVFDAACTAVGLTAAQIGGSSSTLQARMLGYFNRSYQIGYDKPREGWDDARIGSDVEPVDGVISYDLFADARRFEVWTEDPRGTTEAWQLECPEHYTIDKNGITLRTELETVWMRWMPEVVKFSTTQWLTATAYVVGNVRYNGGYCYYCLVAHTSGTFATDLAAAKWVLQPVLAVLEEFLISHIQGSYLRENGQPETGFKMQGQAVKDLEPKVIREQVRNTGVGSGAWAGFTTSGVGSSAAVTSSRYLRFDTDQGLSTLQQLQALENAGITIASDGLMTLPGGYTIYLNAP